MIASRRGLPQDPEINKIGVPTYQRITEYNSDGSIKSQRRNSVKGKYR